MNLKSVEDWRRFTKTAAFPADIPVAPERVYRDRGWQGVGDWLGTGAVANQKKKFRSFDAARTFVRRLGLKSQREWRDYAKSGNLPVDIPLAPNFAYMTSGWNGMGDWLGTGTIAPQKRQFRSFIAARSFVRKLKLSSQVEWTKFVRNGGLPGDIPAKPERIYRDRGWRGLGDWLGTGVVATRDRMYRPFPIARSYARGLRLKNVIEWRSFSSSDAKPLDIPANPDRVYRSSGWLGFRDWLGNGRPTRRSDSLDTQS